MQLINFVAPWITPANRKAYKLLVHCSICEFQYPQTRDLLRGIGYYIAEDQYSAFRVFQDICIDLSIGLRRTEVS